MDSGLGHFNGLLTEVGNDTHGDRLQTAQLLWRERTSETEAESNLGPSAYQRSAFV